MKTKSNSQKSPKDEIGPEMKGADILVKCLEREGVEVVFAYPGGAALEICQALTRSKKIRSILPRFEQGGGFMAHGYARSTGKVGVMVATSGPGATNLVTCIADAYMDSVPTVFITGQVYQSLIGKTAFQETDFFGMTLPIVKHSFLVLKAEDLPIIVKKAFRIAQTGRPGPVVIDIPKDVQQKVFRPVFPAEVSMPGAKPIPHASDAELKNVLDLISKAKKPVLYVGGGIIMGEASKELRKFAKLTGVPVAQSLMAMGAFDPKDPQSLYWFGMHGTVAGNWAVCESDLLVCMGARFHDRVTGNVDKFAPEATIVHMDIDDSEFNKNKHADYTVHTDIKYALKRLIAMIEKGGFKKPDLRPWFSRIDGWKKEHPFPFAYVGKKNIVAADILHTLYEETKGNAIITTGVGQHQMWTAQHYPFDKPRTFISSLGLGTMGFGYPAALGVKVAHPDKQVIDIDGDGSFLMNIQELATAKIEKIPAKVIIINNQFLGMVMQWEDAFYNHNRGNTILGDPKNIGSPENPSGLYPDFVAIAKGFGLNGRRVMRKEELREAIREMLASKESFVLDVIVPNNDHVLPFIPQGKSAKELIIG